MPIARISSTSGRYQITVSRTRPRYARGSSGPASFTARSHQPSIDPPLAFSTISAAASTKNPVNGLPHVEAASAISKMPIQNPGQDWPVWPAEEARPPDHEARLALARWVMPGYFETVGIPLLAGRDISRRDMPGTPRVILLSRPAAAELFPGP